MFPLIAAGALALGKGVSTVIKNKANNKAARLHEDAANRAVGVQSDVYEQTKKDWDPYKQAGISAIGQMGSADFNRDFNQTDFVADPGYQFRMAEGQKALERSAASRGNLRSGSFAKALSQYGQNLASDEYKSAYDRFNSDRDRRFGRLSSLADYGREANNALYNAGSNYATNVGNLWTGAADTKGAAKIANASGWANTVNGIAGMGAGMLAQMPTGGGGGVGGLSQFANMPPTSAPGIGSAAMQRRAYLTQF